MIPAPHWQALDKGNLDGAFKIASTMAEMEGYAAAHLVSFMVYHDAALFDRAGQLLNRVTCMLYVWCCAVMVTHAHAIIALAALPVAASVSVASISHGRTTPSAY